MDYTGIIMSAIISGVISSVLGVFVWLLKRTVDGGKNEIAECKRDIKEMRDDYVTRREIDEIKKTVEGITNKIDFLSENTVRSTDFIRTMTRIEDKIDDLRRDK